MSMIQDSRKATRRLTNSAGIIKSNGKELLVILRDLTEVGACVRLVGTGTIPDRFRLVAAMEKIDEDCVVVRRCGRDCWLEYRSANAATPCATGTAIAEHAEVL